MYRRGRGIDNCDGDYYDYESYASIERMRERERALHLLKVRLDYPEGDKSEAGQHRGSQGELPGVVGLGQLQSSHVSEKRKKIDKLDYIVGRLVGCSPTHG